MSRRWAKRRADVSATAEQTFTNSAFIAGIRRESITRTTVAGLLSRADRAVAADRAIAAGLGQVTRVHRQRQHAVGWVIGVGALTLFGGFTTFLMVLTQSLLWQIPVFVVCAAACAGWLTTLFGPIAGGRQFFVAAEHGVLHWAAGAAEHDVIRYDRASIPKVSRTSKVRTLRLAWTEPDPHAGGPRVIVLPPMSARRALIAAIERSRPGPAGVVAPSAAALGAIVLAAATVWSGVPVVQDVVIGPPVTGDDLAGLCTGGGGLGRAAAYEGAGPHPMALTSEVIPGEPGDPVYFDRPDFTLPVSMDTSAGASYDDVQLVGCLLLVKQPNDAPLTDCAYQGGNNDDLYRGHYRLNVIEAHSGHVVTSMKVDGTTQASDCSAFTYRTQETDGTESDSFTSPDEATYRRLLGPLYTEPSH